MRHPALAALALLAIPVLGATPPAGPTPDPAAEARLARARQILARAPLVDGHNDVPWQYRERVQNHLDRLDFQDTQKLEPAMHTDLLRLRQGGVGGVFWSVYVPVEITGPAAVVAVLEQMDVVRRLAARHPAALEMAMTAADVRRIHRAGRVACLLGMEGGHSIDGSLATLRALYQAGARYMTLTHSRNTEWADSATDEAKHGGLTPFGLEVVREMNRLGMLVDLSHVSPATMKQALAVSAAPVVFSHSSARALTDHPRDVPDDVLALVPGNGGVVMVSFVPPFTSEEVRLWNAEKDGAEARFKALYPGAAARVKDELAAWQKAHPAPRATLAQVADHIEHVRKLAGVDHVGLGSDFDGIMSTPVGLESVARFPDLLAELLRRGWSEADVEKLAGGNVLRALAEAETVAARLQKERLPSEARLEELDSKGK